MKTLAAADGEMDLAELTRVVGLTRTTTYRLLSALESEELVTRGASTSAYRLGPAAIALGAQALRSSDLREAARPQLVALAEETGETATLEVLADRQMLIIDEALGRHIVGTTPSVGTTWAAHATSTGKAMLAALPADRRARVLGSSLVAMTEQTLVDPVALEADLERTQRRGFALSWKELAVDFGAVAAVIRDAAGEPRAAISLGAPTARVRRAGLLEMGQRVVAAARAASRNLGYHAG